MLDLAPNSLVLTPLSPDEIAIVITAFFAQSLKEWGIPSPGVTQGAMVIAGYKMSSGDPTTGIIIALATALGFIIGSTSLYLVSRSAGPLLTKGLNKLWRLNQQRVDELKSKINSAPWWKVMIGRFIPTLMAPITITAGLTKFPFWSFFLGTGLAMLVWLGFFGGIGVIWGNVAIDFLVPKYISIIPVILTIGLVGGIGFWLIWRIKNDANEVEQQ